MQVKIEVPDEAFSVFCMNPDEMAKEMYVSTIVKWFELGKISQSKASELLGISRHEFLETLNRLQVSPFQTTPDELEKELENV